MGRGGYQRGGWGGGDTTGISSSLPAARGTPSAIAGCGVREITGARRPTARPRRVSRRPPRRLLVPRLSGRARIAQGRNAIGRKLNHRTILQFAAWLSAKSTEDITTIIGWAVLHSSLHNHRVC